GAAAASASAPASQLPPADAVVTAEQIAFTEQNVKVPAGKPFTIAFDNRDTVQHNVAIPDAKFIGEVVTGPTATVYNVPALPPGPHSFVCSIHPNMTGTLNAG
ncbi:MAG: cupredoxin domain-containing protein, partial [Chloroflexota bacterium]